MGAQMAIEQSDVLDQLLGLLDETWRGRPGNLPEGWTYYSFPDHGLEQALAGVDAAQAARIIGNNSLAQQVQHTAFANGVFAGWMRGDSGEADWPGSWQTGVIDDAAWERLKAALWTSLADLRNAIETHALETPRRLTQAQGGVAHLIYHHASIRAKLPLL
jgi:hypothetical protein